MAIRPYKDCWPVIEGQVYVDESAQVIGQVRLAEHVSVWPMSVLRGDVHRIEIGRETNIQDGCVLHVTHDGAFSPGGQALILGQGVTVGHRAVLHGCRIGDRCLIGIGATVMDGAVLEDEVMLGAGSLVPPGKRLESGNLYLGSPARLSRPLNEREREFLRYSSLHYVRLKDDYLQACSAVHD